MLEENEEKIDFTKFTNSSGKNDQPIVSENIESVEKSTISYLKKHLGYIVLIISTIVLIDGIFFRVGLEDPLFYFAPFMIPIIGYGWIKNRIQHEFMRQFAKSNNFSYSEKGSLLGLNGTLFQVGHSKSISDVARGEHNGYQLTLFLYNYTTGYGKNSQTHQCTIIQ